MKITNIKSSTVIIQTSSKKIICDPWLFDGEYYGSWYHYPKLDVKKNYFNDLDYIYISHIHPDHFSKKSLQFLNKDIPVLINCYSTKFLKKNIESLGFKVIELEDNKKYKISDNEYITIFSADNCNPELCNKFFGCGKVEDVLGSTQIDSYCLIEDNGFKLLNLNDCPFELAKQSIKQNILKIHEIDFLLVGYAGAGPYPQCFSISDNDKLEQADLKKQKFLDQSLDFIKLIKPKNYMPFAGTYFLGGELQRLNDFRGVPDIWDAFNYINESLFKDQILVNGVLLNAYESFDLDNPNLQKEYIKENKKERDLYLKSISGNLYDYQNISIPKEDEVKSLLEIAYSNFESKRKSMNMFSKTKIAISFFNLYAIFDFNGIKIKYVDEDTIQKINNIIVYRLDMRLLFNILRGPRYAHWNNAEIGSHLQFERRPNFYERNIYYCMNFFHS